MLAPTCLHGTCKACGVAVALVVGIIPKDSKEYTCFLCNLKSMNQYLADGNICASSSTMLKTINEFSVYFGIILFVVGFVLFLLYHK